MHHFLSPVSGQPYTIQSCSEADFEAVKHYVDELELDNRAMHSQQFLTLHNAQNRLVGFGRVREYQGFSELCSLGILPGEREKGLAKEMTAQMIQKATQTTYLVCIIPHFFEEFGFRICTTYPPEIQEKLDYCLDSLAVPEPYVVMKCEQ
jgi:N-acetylglutamate synthase-like GNAT family acetyltransferase